MTSLKWLVVGVCALAFPYGSTSGSAEQGTRCDTAAELVRSTRESLKPNAERASLEDALQNLKRATDFCAGLGDAWYFLSLVGAELKDSKAQYWRKQAETWNSAAMRNGESLYAPVPLASTSTSAAGAVRSPGVASPPPAVPAIHVSSVVRKRWALVVGISRFQDPRINALKYTARDAEAVSAALKQCCEFDSVKTLLDEAATRKNITMEIDYLAKNAEPEDLVVVYMSSHGSPENLDTAGVNYIVTYDTEVSGLYSTAYAMDDLLRALGSRIKSERVIAFLDTCYSGGTYKELPSGWTASSRALTTETGVSMARLEEGLAGSRSLVVDTGSEIGRGRVPQGVGRIIITSSSQAERSWEDDKIQHGYFTYFLLDALTKPGPLSVDDVFGHVRLRVTDAVMSEKRESQHPMIVRSRDSVNLYLKDRIARKPGG
ncbi:MAG TPA: caspase family protein [Vicinamibacterales bacterium]|nr:caspase family protein [Vicinamibacterales bacterium]